MHTNNSKHPLALKVFPLKNGELLFMGDREGEIIPGSPVCIEYNRHILTREAESAPVIV